MPDPLPASEAQGGFPDLIESHSRAVMVRYDDARARGLAHAGALAEAAGLLWVFRPALTPSDSRCLATKIVAHAGLRASGKAA